MGTVAVSGVGDWPHCSLWSDAVGSSSSRRCGEMVCTCIYKAVACPPCGYIVHYAQDVRCEWMM